MPYGSVSQRKTIVCLFPDSESWRHAWCVLPPYLPPSSHHILMWCFPHVPYLGTHCHYPGPGHLRTFSNLPAILPVSALFPYSLFSMLHPDGLSRRLIRPCHALHKASNSSLCLWRKAVLICLVLRPFFISPQPPFLVSLVITPLSHIVFRHTEPLPTLLPPTSLPQHGVPLPVVTNPSCPQWLGTYWVCICWVNKWVISVWPHGPGTPHTPSCSTRDPLLGWTVELPPQLELCEDEVRVALFRLKIPLSRIVQAFPHYNLQEIWNQNI